MARPVAEFHAQCEGSYFCVTANEEATKLWLKLLNAVNPTKISDKENHELVQIKRSLEKALATEEKK